MYIMNNSGPSTLPCGVHPEKLPFILTLNFLAFKNSEIHLTILSSIPYACNFGRKCHCYLISPSVFADDAKFARHINESEDCRELEEAIDLFNKCSSQWLLKLNVKKCHIVSFGRNVDKSHKYKIVDENNQVMELET